MGPYARKRKSMKSIDHRGKPWYLLQSSSDTTKSVLCLTWSNVVSLNPRWTYYKQFKLKWKEMYVLTSVCKSNWSLTIFVPFGNVTFAFWFLFFCLAGALPFCDWDNPGFPKYKAAVGGGGGSIFLYDSDGVLSFDSLRGVNCIFSLAWGGGDEELCFP